MRLSAPEPAVGGPASSAAQADLALLEAPGEKHVNLPERSGRRQSQPRGAASGRLFRRLCDVAGRLHFGHLVSTVMEATPSGRIPGPASTDALSCRAELARHPGAQDPLLWNHQRPPKPAGDEGRVEDPGAPTARLFTNPYHPLI